MSPCDIEWRADCQLIGVGRYDGQMASKRRIVKVVVLAVCGLIAMMGQISFTEFESNIASWINAVGVQNVPPVLNKPYADTVISGAAISVIAVLLGYAGYRGYRNRRPRRAGQDALPWRISLLQLYRLAAKEYDWQFLASGSNHFSDFAEGLRQAGIDNSIRFWGRNERATSGLVGDSNMRQYIESQPLSGINADYWNKYQLDAWRVFSLDKSTLHITDLVEDNFQARTISTDNQKYRVLYYDLHVDRQQAEHWLASEAETYKGRYNQRHER